MGTPVDTFFSPDLMVKVLLILFSCFVLVLASSRTYEPRNSNREKSMHQPSFTRYSKGESTPIIYENPSSNSLKSISSPRGYKPSAPIPIPYPNEARDLTNHKEADWYQYADDNSSISSGSSENSFLGGFFMFEMSYDPISEEMRKLRQEKRENRRRLNMESIKNSTARKSNEPISPESPKSALYYIKEEEEEEYLEEVASKRAARYENLPNIESNYSDLDNDSDFGGEESKDTFIGLSF